MLTAFLLVPLLTVAAISLGARTVAFDLNTEPADHCVHAIEPAECRRQVARSPGPDPSAEQWKNEERHSYAVHTHSLGVGATVATHFATAIGWLTVLAVGAPVAGIRRRRRADPAALSPATGARPSFAAALLATWLASIAVLSLTVVVAAVVVPTATPDLEVAQSIGDGDALSASIGAVARSTFLLLGIASIVVCLYRLTTRRAATVVGSMLLIGIGVALHNRFPLTISTLTRDIMDLTPISGNIPFRYVWRDDGANRLRPDAAALVWAATIAIPGVIAALHSNLSARRCSDPGVA